MTVSAITYKPESGLNVENHHYGWLRLLICDCEIFDDRKSKTTQMSITALCQGLSDAATSCCLSGSYQLPLTGTILPDHAPECHSPDPI
jgi:hypothetical protein